MRHYSLECITLLVFVFLIGADSSSVDPKVLQSDYSKKVIHQATTENEFTDSRLLRSYSASNKGYREERTVGSVFEKLTSMFKSKGIPEKLQKWLQDETPVDIVFKGLHLDVNKPGKGLFDNPHFAAWVEYADTLSAKIPEMSAISSLTRRFGDDRLYNFIQRGKMNPSTENLAKELETKQIQHWVAVGKDPDEVFRLFELQYQGRHILEQPEYITWVKYVDDLNTKHPEEPIWMYSTLTKYFKDDDLFIMTGVAKMLGKSKPLARKMEDDWFQGALHHKKTPYEAFRDLRLGKNFDANVISQSDLVDIWIKYLEAFNTRFPHEKTTMLETFLKSFGNTEVRKMIETAKKHGWPRNLAGELKSAQLKLWLDSEKTIDNVFDLLQLDKNVITYYMQDERYFSMWVSYIDAYIKAKPGEKAAVFSDLQSSFKDRPLNTIINKGKKYPSMESIGITIQMDMMAKYLANNESPEVVFKIFGLEREGDSILGSPLFQSWMRYLDIFNKRNPTQQESWFDVIRLNRGYGMIEKAMENPSTVQMAKRVEKEWFSFWLNTETLPKQVFTSLHLNQVNKKVNALADPKFGKWTTYLDAFNARYPDKKTTVFDELVDHFNYRKLLQMLETAENDATTKILATNLQDKLFDKWVADGVKPEKLQQILSGAQPSKEMIERYTKKLASINTS